ncbi:MAG: hypothetical protein K0Q64_1813 [Nitrobacter vulgaris]|nr:hypothetical protein [Nitrobacter vulgaris]
MMHLMLVDGDDEHAIRFEQPTRNDKSASHEGEPLAMTPGVRLIDVVVVVFPVTGARVVGRVDIDAIDPAGIKPFKQLEGVVVVGLKEQVMRRIASLLEALDRYDGGGTISARDARAAMKPRIRQREQLGEVLLEDEPKLLFLFSALRSVRAAEHEGRAG